MIRFVVAVLFAFGAFAEEAAFFNNPLPLGAHRGGSLLWPENTVHAFEHAAQQWPHILLEADVRVSKDGHLVLMHDATVERTTEGTGRVEEMTFEELRALDAAHDFTRDNATFPLRGKGIKIPTLQEALAAAPKHRFLVELKAKPEHAPLLMRAIQEAGAQPRVAFASFDPKVMEALRKEKPDALFCYDMNSGLALIQALRGGKWEDYEPAARILSVTSELHTQFRISPAEIERIQAKGIVYQLHTLNSREEMEQALKSGVQSILTDNPLLLDEVLKEIVQVSAVPAE